MMSNCAFWSVSGELVAVHGVGPADPLVTFGPWAASRRLPPGRLISLSSSFPLPLDLPLTPGWQTLPWVPTSRRKAPRACDVEAPVATPAPALDWAAAQLFPGLVHHEKFTLKAWPTWVATVSPQAGESPAGWYAALVEDSKTSQFLLRLVPHKGRLPGEGWRNMLAWSLRSHGGVRLVPLNGLPSPEALSLAPAWEYRVEAGRGVEAAAWDVQVLPSRRWVQQYAPGVTDLWEATALLRWVRPGAPKTSVPAKTSVPSPAADLRWADLFARLPIADARLLVQNVLTTLPGGASAAAVLFYDTIVLPPSPDGRVLARHVPQDGLPLALLSTLFGRRAWHEVERAKRFLPLEAERRVRRAEALADLDRRLAEGRLVWSPQGLALWETWYREPQRRRLEAELAVWRRGDRWNEVLSGDPRVPEALLRGLDVTDAALCLRDVPDARWRRFVTARREAELREEQAFCQVWEARGELTLERQIDAWRSFEALVQAFPLTENPGRK